MDGENDQVDPAQEQEEADFGDMGDAGDEEKFGMEGEPMEGEENMDWGEGEQD